MTFPRAIRRITGATVFVGSGLEPKHVDLEIVDGRIARIEPAAAGRAVGPDDIDATGMFVMPGMVDCHDHLRYLGPGRRVGEGLPFDQLIAVLAETTAAMGPAEYEIGPLLGLVQRLKVGITTVADHCYPYHTDGLDEATLTGYRRAGVRWAYARGVQTHPELVAEPWEVAEQRIRSLLDDGLLSPGRLFVSPVSIRQAEPEDYRRSRGLADELGCGLYTHVAETQPELARWRAKTGTSPIRALDELGFLTARTVLVHCVLLDDGEIELLGERGCHVIHCPSNHMRWAKGFTRVPELLGAGVNVALGVDNELDLLTEMRVERGLQSLRTMDRDAISLQTVMGMATCRGARALGLEDLAEGIAPGAAADLVLLDASALEQVPVIDPRYAVVNQTHPGHVRHVLVDGELLVEDGMCTTVDERALREEAESIAAAWIARTGRDELPWFRLPTSTRAHAGSVAEA
jgi:cytosine/adenosine deaminase-related metal-dependent hydrolase